ncbi:hypothetical protein [Microbacterium sp. P05]|uniref:hypothetical protein n=1 Tax=Microbacterium sp. P05 TaxID=3366948 RepID=UPI0037477159
MSGRTLKHGDTIRTPEGEVGRVLRRSRQLFVDPFEYRRYDLDGEGDVLIYAVLLESGEMRHYSFEALAASNNPSA